MLNRSAPVLPPTHHAQVAERISKLGVPAFTWLSGRAGPKLQVKAEVQIWKLRSANCAWWVGGGTGGEHPCPFYI